MGGGAVESVGGHFHDAHGIFFDASRRHGFSLHKNSGVAKRDVRLAVMGGLEGSGCWLGAVLGGFVGVRSLVEFGDEHWGEIDQAILAFDARKVAAMADQFVGDLINDESGFGGGGEGIESVL